MEIGAGNSSLYFLSRACHVFAIEPRDDYINSLSQLAKALGHEVIIFDAGMSCESLPFADAPTLILCQAKNFAQIPEGIFGASWDVIVNDGIARRACLQQIIAARSQSLIVLDNAEYAANRGNVPHSVGHPARMRCYQDFLRASNYSHYLFEQIEGRDGHSIADATGFESPHRWVSAISWRRDSIFEKLMLTHLGLPLVTMADINDQDLLQITGTDVTKI